tara:strand:- start:1204 stop:1503 length:300 start_codon:yes stop_codon:yes gene_type:complete
MKKAYWVGIVNVKNHNEYKKYADIAGPSLIAAGAKILSRGGKIKNLEGEGMEMNRIVVIEFPSMERAESFYQSDEYRKGLKYINSEVADRFLNIAEAVD